VPSFKPAFGRKALQAAPVHINFVLKDIFSEFPGFAPGEFEAAGVLDLW